MPTQAYKGFKKDIETVEKLVETYHQVKKGKGSRGSYDHIIKSAMVYLASSTDAYIKDVVKECCDKHIALCNSGLHLPNDVRHSLNRYVIDENNDTEPMSLCGEGWKDIYRSLAKMKTNQLRSLKLNDILVLLEEIVGVNKRHVEQINNIDKFNSVVEFQMDLMHKVRADSNVKIQQVENNEAVIKELAINIDREIITAFKDWYPKKRFWYDAY